MVDFSADTLFMLVCSGLSSLSVLIIGGQFLVVSSLRLKREQNDLYSVVTEYQNFLLYLDSVEKINTVECRIRYNSLQQLAQHQKHNGILSVIQSYEPIMNNITTERGLEIFRRNSSDAIRETFEQIIELTHSPVCPSDNWDDNKVYDKGVAT